MKVQDCKYTKVGDYLYFGVEINNSDSSGYIDSKLKITTTGNQAFEIPLPYFLPNSTVAVGFITNMLPDPDNLLLEAFHGTEHFEHPYTDDLVVEIKSADEATRTITYTIINNGNEEISNASLDLVFYNKGKLIGGLRQKIENLLPGRTHYVDVKIPNEITFTEIIPNLLLPASEHLTFLGYFLERKRLRNIISSHEQLDKVPDEQFVDRTEDYKQAIIDATEAEKAARKRKAYSKPRTIFKNLWVAFYQIFSTLKDLLIKFHPAIQLVVIWAIATALSWLTDWGVAKYYVTASVPVVYLGLVLITFIPFYVIKLRKEKNKFDTFTTGIPRSEKEYLIKKAIDQKAKAEETLANYTIEGAKQELAKINEEIHQENAKIDQQNQINQKISDDAGKRLSMFENKFARWQELLDSFNEDELEVIYKVYKSGVYDDDSILNELDKVLAARERMEDKQEAAVRHSEIISEMQYQGSATRDTVVNVGSELSGKLDGIRADNAAHAAAQSAQTAELISATRQQTKAIKGNTSALSYGNTQREIANTYARGIYISSWNR